MSTFGKLFKISTFGESHCKSVGVIIDGCPPGLPISQQQLQVQLSRRRPGQNQLTTPRDEKDQVSIQSGVEFGFTLGTPICLTVENLDQKPHDYKETDYYPRPSHADYSYLTKYNIKASSGGGRSSARETIGRVAAGALAEHYLNLCHNIEIVAFVSQIGHVSTEPTNLHYDPKLDKNEFIKNWNGYWETLKKVQRNDVDANEVRCPDPIVAEEMRNVILESKQAQNSIGGVVTCVIRNCPAGLGEPCFDKFEAMLAHAMLSIPATKGFELGSGTYGTCIPGHIHNDPFYLNEKTTKLGTSTNFSGGIQGGITNGEDIYFKVQFKPPATIGMAQETVQFDGKAGVLEAKGRHDPCVLPRAVPIVEAMASLVVMDALMIQNSRTTAFKNFPKTMEKPPAILLGEKK